MKEFRLVAFGDSLTYGYGVLSHIAYPSRLARELPEKNPQLRWKVYNRGINGETTREAKERLESQVLWVKPHLTVILLGSNDSAGPSTEGCGRRIPSISSERPSRRN